MYDETNVPGPEYRVRTVARYVVTRYRHGYTGKDPVGQPVDIGGSSGVIGEFRNEQQAFEVAQALAARESFCNATVSV